MNITECRQCKKRVQPARGSHFYSCPNCGLPLSEREEFYEGSAAWTPTGQPQNPYHPQRETERHDLWNKGWESAQWYDDQCWDEAWYDDE